VELRHEARRGARVEQVLAAPPAREVVVDPPLWGELRELDLLPPRERVRLGQDGDVGVVDEMPGAEPDAGGEPVTSDEYLNVGTVVRPVGDGLAELEIEPDPR